MDKNTRETLEKTGTLGIYSGYTVSLGNRQLVVNVNTVWTVPLDVMPEDITDQDVAQFMSQVISKKLKDDDKLDDALAQARFAKSRSKSAA